ncbi:MAG: hypothetical protein AAF211_25765, partial [Myxococcota bacterium]
MGIRVRKLARELRQSPRDVLQLLKSLGFERYQSPEDMISDTVAARVRSNAAKRPTNGHRAPDPVRARSTTPRPPPKASGGDVMAQLVPGVKRVRTDQRTSGTLQGAEDAEVQRRRAELVRAETAHRAHGEALDTRERELDARQSHLAEEATRLDALAAALEGKDQELASAVEAFEQARAAFVTEQQLRTEVATKPNVVELLRERGLRGLDEAQRALGALASGHALGPLVKDLAVTDEEGFRKALAERLILVGGDLPEGLTVPGVSVSPDRADLPGADVLARTAKRLSEQWMLFGFRSVTIAGMPPRWHGLVRALVDSRVTLVFVPPPTSAPERLGPAEAWFAWGAPLTDRA